jgi:hypothetical protein
MSFQRVRGTRQLNATTETTINVNVSTTIVMVTRISW